MAKVLGRKVKDFRLNKGWSQAELAVAMGVGMSTVVRIESGDYEPSDLIRVRVENFLKGKAA